MVMPADRSRPRQGQRGDRRGRSEERTARSSRSRPRSATPITTSRCTGRWWRCSGCSPGRRGGPTALTWWYDSCCGGWTPEPTLSELLTLLMFFAALKFTVALLILKWMPLRLALTPGATKHRRVRRRAVDRVQGGGRAPHRRPHRHPHLSVDGRAAGRDRRRRSDPQGHRRRDTWGEAMAALLVEVRAGRPGDGIVAAIEQVGAVLAEHFPRSGDRRQRNPRQTDRAMNLDDLPPAEIMCEGKFVRAPQARQMGICRPHARHPRGRHPRRI